MRIINFADIQDEFIQRVHADVYCAMVTVNRDNRPRSRIIHPIWEGQVGWVASNPNSHKSKHLADNPYVSLIYMKNPFQPVYVDCRTEWATDTTEEERIWHLFLDTPAPVGYDPALFFMSKESENYGVLKLIPWRIELFELSVEGSKSIVWRE